MATAPHHCGRGRICHSRLLDRPSLRAQPGRPTRAAPVGRLVVNRRVVSTAVVVMRARCTMAALGGLHGF